MSRFTVASVVWLLAGCTRCTPDTVETDYSEPITSRPYRVVSQKSHDPKHAAPVLIVLHPYATRPDVVVAAYRLEKTAVDERGWVMVLPEGTRDARSKLSWNATTACCGKGEARPDDLGYLQGVLVDVGRKFTLDPDRVYVLGVSNGAFMAHRWACTEGSKVRSIVAISGAGVSDADPPCRPSVPVDVLHIHGSSDETIRYGGGATERGTYPSVEQTMANWCVSARCTGEPVRVQDSPLFGSSLVRKSWNARARLVLWTVEGGGHQLDELRRNVESMLDFLDGDDV